MGLSHPTPAELTADSLASTASLSSAHVPPLQLSRGRAVPWCLASRKPSQHRRFIGEGAFSLRRGGHAPSLLHFPAGQSGGRWHWQRCFGERRDRGSKRGGTGWARPGQYLSPPCSSPCSSPSVAAERNLSPGLLLLHDAKYLSLFSLFLSRTHAQICGND